jgi:hypothetical protein
MPPLRVDYWHRSICEVEEIWDEIAAALCKGEVENGGCGKVEMLDAHLGPSGVPIP